jgi:hypothetical protein
MRVGYRDAHAIALAAFAAVISGTEDLVAGAPLFVRCHRCDKADIDSRHMQRSLLREQMEQTHMKATRMCRPPLLAVILPASDFAACPLLRCMPLTWRRLS